MIYDILLKYEYKLKQKVKLIKDRQSMKNTKLSSQFDEYFKQNDPMYDASSLLTMMPRCPVTKGGKILEKCTVKELKEKAKKRKITGYSKLCKAKLIDILSKK